MHNVRTEEERFKTVIHPVLGPLDFENTSYLVSDNTPLKMTVFTPLHGTNTGEKNKTISPETNALMDPAVLMRLQVLLHLRDV